MNQQPQNDYLRVNKPGKNIRKSHPHQLNANSNPIPQPQPQVQVYITNKNDFKSLVQQLTSYESCECLPQNLPKCQKMISEPINPGSSIPPSLMAVQKDPDVSLYMSYLQSVLEDSSGSNGDQYQQAHSQPQAPKQSMPHSNGFEPVMIPTTFPSYCFNGSPQQMKDAYSLQSIRVDYSPPLTPNFTFSSMNQPGVLGPDQDCVGPHIFDVPFEIE